MSVTRHSRVADATSPGVSPVPIGVAFPGDPAGPATWSGIPSGVIAGLRAIGALPRPIAAAPSQRLHALLRNGVALAEIPSARRGDLRQTLQLSRAIARNTPAMGWVYSKAAHRAAANAGRLAGIIQIGTGYSLPQLAPTATFEDMTIRQALDLGYPEWRALTQRQIANRLDSQRRAYEVAATCCFTTWWAGQSAIDDYGVPADKVRVVGVGRNHVVEPPPDRDWTIPRFLFVGWDWERKNGPAVLRAFAHVRETYGEATLDIVGKHPRVEAPGVVDHGLLRLDQPAARAKLETLFGGATCFVMPSKCEPSALAYVEAMTAGLACIGTVVGGAANLIGPGGCVVDPGSDAAVTRAMLAYCDPDVAAAAGAAGKERSALFTWPAVAARLLLALDLPIGDDQDRWDFVDRAMSPELTTS
jgi:glycosyltransferase involved in cell wall biosynthesis